jgi:gluconate 5-dehydrogenase
VILAARSVDALHAAAAKLNGEAVTLDVTDDASIEKAAKAAGEIDVLVNVAGMNIRKPFEDFTRDEIEKILDTNLVGLMRLTQIVGREMIARKKGGKIVNIGSLTSMIGLPYVSNAFCGRWLRSAPEHQRTIFDVWCSDPNQLLNKRMLTKGR